MTKYPIYIRRFANLILAWISQLVTQKVFISVLLSLLHNFRFVCAGLFLFFAIRRFFTPLFAL